MAYLTSFVAEYWLRCKWARRWQTQTVLKQRPSKERCLQQLYFLLIVAGQQDVCLTMSTRSALSSSSHVASSIYYLSRWWWTRVEKWSENVGFKCTDDILLIPIVYVSAVQCVDMKETLSGMELQQFSSWKNTYLSPKSIFRICGTKSPTQKFSKRYMDWATSFRYNCSCDTFYCLCWTY